MGRKEPSQLSLGPRRGRFRGFSDSFKAKFAGFTYQEDKRCMLVSLKLVADFSRGCARPPMQPPIPATHPRPALCTETSSHC